MKFPSIAVSQLLFLLALQLSQHDVFGAPPTSSTPAKRLSGSVSSITSAMLQMQSPSSKQQKHNNDNVDNNLKSGDDSASIKVYRLLSLQDTNGTNKKEEVWQFVRNHGIRPKNANAKCTVLDHILDGSKPTFASQFISTSFDPNSVMKFATTAMEKDDQNMNEDQLFIATIKIPAAQDDYYDLSSYTEPLSIQHRKETEVDKNFRANQVTTSMKECIIKRSIQPTEIISIQTAPEFFESIVRECPQQEVENASDVNMRNLPPLNTTKFFDRPANIVEKNVEYLREIFSRTDISGKGTHFLGLYNDLKSVKNGLTEDEKPTDEVLTFIQANIHQAFFDWVSKDGFDIRDCTPQELNAFSSKLPDNWSISSDDEMNTVDDNINSRAYLKLSNQTVVTHRQTCHDIVNDPDATCRAKGIANQIMRDMEHKHNDQYHCAWYAGETVRPFPKRMKEKYPKSLERFGVTNRYQIAQSPLPTDEWLSKDLSLFLESAVGGIIEGSINKALASKMDGDEYVPRPFHNMSCVNIVPTGRLEHDSRSTGYMLTLFMKSYYRGNEMRRVCDITSNPTILNYIAQYKTSIALANNIVPHDSYEPTMMEFCSAWGTMMYECKLGIFDKTKTPIADTDYVKNGEVVVAAGDHYANWGQYLHHMGLAAMKHNTLSHLARVAAENHNNANLLTSPASLDEDLFPLENDKQIFRQLQSRHGQENLHEMLAPYLRRYQGNCDGIPIITLEGSDNSTLPARSCGKPFSCDNPRNIVGRGTKGHGLRNIVGEVCEQCLMKVYESNSARAKCSDYELLVLQGKESSGTLTYYQRERLAKIRPYKTVCALPSGPYYCTQRTVTIQSNPNIGISLDRCVSRVPMVRGLNGALTGFGLERGHRILSITGTSTKTMHHTEAERLLSDELASSNVVLVVGKLLLTRDKDGNQYVYKKKTVIVEQNKKAEIMIKMKDCIPGTDIHLSSLSCFVSKVNPNGDDGSLRGQCKKNDMILSINGIDLSVMNENDVKGLVADQTKKREFVFLTPVKDN